MLGEATVLFLDQPAVSMKHVGTAGGLLRQICADMPEVLRLDDNDESEVQGNTRNAV